MIRFAIFADIHGKFLLPFKLVNHYQQITGKKVDWILQCGDMGAFPDKKTMDKATLRHAHNDPDELGFIHDFCQEKKDIRQFLDTLNINMLCVRGNHEDHAFLDKLENASQNPMFPIDIYGRVFVCRSATPIELSNQQDICSIVGIGRIGDKKGRKDPAFIQDYERLAIKKLLKKPQDWDILLTHDKPSESERGYGSVEIDEVLNQVAFRYHFYGHTGEPFNCQMADNGITESIKIKELEFNKEGKLENGCMLIVEKEQDNFQIEVVPLNSIIGFMKNTWKYLSLSFYC